MFTVAERIISTKHGLRLFQMTCAVGKTKTKQIFASRFSYFRSNTIGRKHNNIQYNNQMRQRVFKAKFDDHRIRLIY